VKSVVGEFSSGVSMCRKKDLSQIWGPPFCSAPRQGHGGPSSGSDGDYWLGGRTQIFDSP